MSYGVIKAKIKTGDEHLSSGGKDLPAKLSYFWKWSVSDILSNATRGIFAEFIVATATKTDLSIPREEWAAYDLVTPGNIKIEVKSAAYIQSWYQKELSKISFSIKRSFYWDRITNKQSKTKGRYADIYVMCLLANKDQETINPFDMDQWDFYVVSVGEINNYKRSQQSITLKSLESLARPIKYDQLESEIKAQFEEKSQEK